MISTIKLLELMSARMFHDLAGPVGAVHNSVEFLEEDNPIIKEKALNLIKSSSNESILRLKFFRQAYGSFQDNNSVHSDIILNLIQDFLQNHKIKLDWQIDKNNEIPPYIAKAILNFIIISVHSMIQGGTLVISLKDNELTISMQGNGIIFHKETSQLLQGNLNQIILSSTNIQIYYTHIILNEAKAKLYIKEDKNIVQFTIAF